MNTSDTPLRNLATVLLDPPPWWMPHVATAQRILSHAPAGKVVPAINGARTSQVPVRFVDQSALAPEDAYESFIARERSVPTRENLHDLLNGLMWLQFPQIKQRLNSLQVQQIRQLGTAGPRGALRDALTLFDENGALLQAPPPLIDALRQKDWTRLFLDLRAHWSSAQLVLFGHALLEKLMQPRKPITAHVWIVEEIDDAAIAASITEQAWSAKPFLPLPVLGVPGWWPENESPDFYADEEVFRCTTRRVSNE